MELFEAGDNITSRYSMTKPVIVNNMSLILFDKGRRVLPGDHLSVENLDVLDFAAVKIEFVIL